MKALFVCVQNAGRSQMAQALYERLGVDLAGRLPRGLTREDVEWADVVLTMGCGDHCPYIPGKRYVDRQLDDPAGEGIDEVRAIRDEIARRVSSLR